MWKEKWGTLKAMFNVEKGKVAARTSRKRKHFETVKVAQDVTTTIEVILASSKGQTRVFKKSLLLKRDLGYLVGKLYIDKQGGNSGDLAATIGGSSQEG
ncbi:hypothetical protein VNO78_18284 [Psophocarpus tetragonolobus]|uniref:Uncharacterized protein n=1 Tax=Psophocarpus tetragonolobus TaxID=3891 RepID=A0AAN9SJ63_PSOTE